MVMVITTVIKEAAAAIYSSSQAAAMIMVEAVVKRIIYTFIIKPSTTKIQESKTGSNRKRNLIPVKCVKVANTPICVR